MAQSSGWHRFAAFGPPGAKFGPQKGLKAPFAAKFGMHLGVLTVFSGPVHGRGLKGSQNGSKQAQNGPKQAQNGSKWLKVLSK